MRKLNLISYCLYIIALTFCSCNKDAIYMKSVALPGNIWSYKSPLKFDIPVADSVNMYNIFINIRNESEYPFSNLYLFIDITSPKNITERDTMECILATPEGRWLGHGLGDIWDNKILFKRVHFPNKGNYTFTLTQAMRVDSLPMIMNAGISVEKLGIRN